MGETALVHIISELGGCIVGLLPDEAGISHSLDTYARSQNMERMALLNPLTDDLTEWAGAAAFAIKKYGIEGPVLVGTHHGDGVLLGVSKRYGYPGPGAPLDDIVEVVRFRPQGSH